MLIHEPGREITYLIASSRSILVQSHRTGDVLIAPGRACGILSHHAQIFLLLTIIELAPREDYGPSGSRQFGAPQHDNLSFTLAGNDEQFAAAKKMQQFPHHCLHSSFESGFDSHSG